MSQPNNAPLNGAGPENTQQEQQFNILRLYAKDISVETPSSPSIFQQEWKPNVDVKLNTQVDKLNETTFEVKLVITVTTHVNDKTAFLVEVHQAGIFAIANFQTEQLKYMLGSYCPNILFPFARELIADLIVRAGFPPLYLTPINFDALYEQQVKQEQASEKEGVSPSSTSIN